MAEDLAMDDVRALAATKFDALAVDPSAFAAEAWAKRSFDEGCHRRLATAVLGEDDEALVRAIHDDGLAEATQAMMDTFEACATEHRAATEIFEAVQLRLAVALCRYAYRLDRDGNPLPSN